MISQQYNQKATIQQNVTCNLKSFALTPNNYPFSWFILIGNKIMLMIYFLQYLKVPDESNPLLSDPMNLVNDPYFKVIQVFVLLFVNIWDWQFIISMCLCIKCTYLNIIHVTINIHFAKILNFLRIFFKPRMKGMDIIIKIQRCMWVLDVIADKHNKQASLNIQ